MMSPMKQYTVPMSIPHDVDLNGLRLLCAVHRHGSVTRAADDLGVTQSAVSHGLRKLRDQLGDPLFVRVGKAMQPTPRGDALARRVGPHLQAIGAAVEAPERFVAATSTRTFRLASLDLLNMLWVPPLAAALQASAPQVGLEVRPHDEQTHVRFDRGELDAAIHPVLAGAGEALRPAGGFRQSTLRWEGFSLFSAAGQPVPSSLDAFCDARHLLVGPGSGPGVVDRALDELGRTRRVVLRTTSFAGALALVREAGLVLVAPTSLGLLAPEGVTVSEPPVDLPRVQVTLVWPERLHHDDGHRWFRGQVADVARRM